MSDPYDPNEPTQQMPDSTPPAPPDGGPGVAGLDPDDDEAGGFWHTMPTPVAAAIGALVVLAFVLLLALFSRGGDDDAQLVTDTTPTVEVTETPTEVSEASPTEAPTAEPDATHTPTEEPEPTATEAPEPPVDPEQFASAVWPWFDSDVRYTDPVEAARGFATELVGFADPAASAFMQGDSRSGEVEITTRDGGPVTTVFVRQLGREDTWWVLGAATAAIEIDAPETLDEIADPLAVRGSAVAFEGTVDVEIRADGETDPLYEGFVTGGGVESAPFDEELTWDDPGQGSGAVVFTTRSAEDGSVQEAAVVRVSFG